MTPDAKRFKSALDEYAESEGFDTNDPRVRSVLDPRVDEFDSWIEDKPDWVQVGDISKATIKKAKE